MTQAQEVIRHMETLGSKEQRDNLMRFFKTAPGEYGYGDEFLGLKVPQTRTVVGTVARTFPIGEVPELLTSCWHEVRLCGLLILVDKFERQSTKRLLNDETAMHQRDEILAMYLHYADRANNWDLVDMSAPKILGHWLLLPTSLGGATTGQHRDYKLSVMDSLARSGPLQPGPSLRAGSSGICEGLWRQRMSIVSTWKTSQQGDPSWCLRYAELLMHHPHDLMHKAVGWMLREMGKRVSMDLLRDFLSQHAGEMSRTTLRYAIEKMDDRERQFWMQV